MEFLGTCHTCGVLLKTKNMKLKHLCLTFLIVFLLFSFLASISLFVVSVHATGITRVQGNARGTSTTNSISITMGSNPTGGNVLILVYGSAAAGFVNAITGITETNVAWANVLVKSSGWGRTEEIWFGIVSADASNAITVNLTSTSYYGAVADVCEYSGVKTSGYLDKTATDAGWGTSPPTGTTATTTQANELWIGGMAVADDPTTPTQTDPTNGFTLFDGVPYIDGISVGFLEKIVTSTGAASSGVSISYSCYHNGCIATFFAAAGDTTPPTYSNISAV